MKFIKDLGATSHQIELRVKPNSDKFQLQVFEDSIDVWVENPPHRGKANREIIDEFSTLLDLSSECIRIVRGHKSSIKILEISELTGTDLKKKLLKSH